MANKDKEKTKERARQWYWDNKDIARKCNKKWKQEHKDELKEKAKIADRKRKYGLTLEQIDEILITQDHRCAICRKLLKESRRCIDHNHKTGKVRGILCVRCNAGLWPMEDENYLEKALVYLSKEGVL